MFGVSVPALFDFGHKGFGVSFEDVLSWDNEYFDHVAGDEKMIIRLFDFDDAVPIQLAHAELRNH